MRRSRSIWIGWDFRSQYGRLNLIANNSRFLILPGWHRPNIGSRVLSLTERPIGGHGSAIRCYCWRLLLTPSASMAACGVGVYWAANWMELGLTQGYRRTREGYSGRTDAAPKRVFVRPL